MNSPRENAAMQTTDVEALRVMTEVTLRASGADVPAAGGSVTVGSRVGELAQHSLGHIHHARQLLASQPVVTGTRFALPKRLLLRGSRLFTHRIVAAGSELADAVETLLQVHNEALDEFERQANALRAQLATAELALQDQFDGLAGAGSTGPASGDGATASSATASLEARVRLLEAELASVRALNATPAVDRQQVEGDDA
ncbi:hypothetical protein [Cellulomonas xiejunii]|uniref:Uncharacterized protein n=1 Tax=Cellulomonas xiejunii TaxID=2968083 RepID=A0ABY5KN84_9CELL|nr:hypothetical protein [Cellulomonas xiejunii]MCC2312912.1 hypothetical protein [Cellulomonas xiejunii]MCC2320218.1 hypothetical protein [Cellulomonas xiejunii]UUI70525.1 hypothetical protein NP048_11995 [Cellulomonas xiejunii]